MKYIKNISTNPCYNLALEEYVHRNFTDGNYLLLWQNHNTIVIGKNQNTLEEINPEGVSAHGVTVVRRNTGGGAVYHDMGDLNFSFITDWSKGLNNSFSRFALPVIRALKYFGIEAEFSGRNDILVDGRKISGNAQHIHGGRILHHGTLLVNSDLSIMPQILQVKESKIQSKGVKSVRSRVANIQEFSSRPVEVEELKAALIRAASHPDPVDEILLSSDQLDQIQRLAREKYESKAWNYGASPTSTYSSSQRFPGGELKLWLDVKGDVIQSASFTGDFLSLKSTEEVCEKLKGLVWSQDEVKTVLSQLPIHLYFGSITLNEILTLFVPADPL